MRDLCLEINDLDRLRSKLHTTGDNFNFPVSELLLFNANSTLFQLYHGANKLIFNEMMMRSALY